jgi:uncharacterized protein (DUF1800 family)
MPMIDKMSRNSAAVIAATRLGFAACGDDLAVIGRDPRGWALQQLGRAAPPLLTGDLPSSASMVVAEFEMRGQKGDLEARRAFNERMKAVYFAEIAARTGTAITSDTPLLERLCHFWSNHFTVSILRPVVRGFAAAFEREAIRPHVTGHFHEMLLAVVRHPAMLFYLDNAVSIGPDSIVGRGRDKGLNENLGRELLELHTLGVDGGYTQQDVEALARILTGWSVARLNEPDPGGFRFRPAVHEPGSKTLLGRVYAEGGYAEGEAALAMLATHPATAHHIAFKLARHFIADAPPPDSVRRIARVFSETGGNLRQVTAAVVMEEALWQSPFAKLRMPDDLVIAACRVGGFTPPPPMLVGSLRLLDQLPFFAPSPAGWPDTAAHWVAPEAVLRRADWCQRYAEHMPEAPDPVALAEASFGDALPEEVAQAIRRAPTRRLGMALLLASPQFQRR